MPEFVATTAGLFPLPDWAKASLSSLKGHQKDDLIDGNEPPSVDQEYDEARTEIIETQTGAGLGRVVEGQLRWDDMLAHPLAVNDAVEPRGLVRYYDNNNFYREPVVVDELTPSGDVADELSAAAAVTDVPLQAVLPGPYTLASLATDAHYGDEAEFRAAIAELLAGEVERFPTAETLFLLEPSLVTAPPAGDGRSDVRRGIDTVAEAFPGDVVVHTYWGGLDDRTYGTLLDTAITGVGVDLISAPERSAAVVREFGIPGDLALGVVDGQNTRLESPADVRDRVDRFVGRLPASASPDTVYVTANTELFHLPVPKFVAKLEVLGDAVAPEVAA